MRRVAVAAIGVLLVTFAGLLSAARGSVVPTEDGVRQTATAVAPSAAELAEIHRTIDAVNAVADTDPARQRAVLQALVADDRAADQRSCAPATTTVRFEPVWTGLRPDPNGSPNTFVLPTLVRSYTGGRITGTDTAALLISIFSDGAHLPPLCVA
ncbi:hypothetical protein [Nakamurella lactea]|uniref:hypothetical protein n=1 Tax=Nakamurella lactea TaxID=459515 RepID=UPI0012B5B74B|nr:hypothetical protein [Nakamurella lactea]